MTSQLALEEESQGIPPLVWVILVAVLIALGIWWWLRRPSEHDSHGATSHDQAHAKADHPVQPAAHTATSHAPAAKAAPPVTHAAPPAAVPPPPPAKPDDLTIVEGIGPKINTILQEAGIKTFKQLAETPVSRLQELMLQANLRIADPASWPEQAALAAAGKMEDLQKLQDSLKGGRKA